MFTVEDVVTKNMFRFFLLWHKRHNNYILVTNHLSEFYLGFILGKRPLTDSGTVAGPGLTRCSSPPADFMMIHVKEKHIWNFINSPWMCASFREIPIHKWIPLPGDLTEEPFHGTYSIFSILHPPCPFLKLQWHVSSRASNKTAGAGTNDLWNEMWFGGLQI